MGLLENGLENKHMGKSGVNDTSSRSHCIFEIRIKTSSNEIDRIPLNKYGKISVVDLAGFEHQDCRGSEVFNQKMNILHELRGSYKWEPYPQMDEYGKEKIDSSSSESADETVLHVLSLVNDHDENEVLPPNIKSLACKGKNKKAFDNSR